MMDFQKARFLPLALAFLVASPLPGAESPAVPVLVKVLEQAEVSPREPGVLIDIDAAEGRQVAQGDTLAQMDDAAERYQQAKAKLEMEIAAKHAASEIDLLAARKTMAVAQSLYKRTSESAAKFPSSVSEAELERLKLEADKSELAVQQAEHDLEIAQLELDVTKNEFEFATRRVERRRIVAPFDGVVVEREGRRGEWVQPGDKVIRVVRLDRLRVEGFLEAREAGRELEGRPVRLIVAMPGPSNQRYDGRLVFVSPEVDPVNDQVRVLADIENPRLTLRPGLRGTITILSPDAP